MNPTQEMNMNIDLVFFKSIFLKCFIVQGDQKNVPPFSGRDEKSSRKTEYSIFKNNLFWYYLENFVKSLQN